MAACPRHLGPRALIYLSVGIAPTGAVRFPLNRPPIGSRGPVGVMRLGLAFSRLLRNLGLSVASLKPSPLSAFSRAPVAQSFSNRRASRTSNFEGSIKSHTPTGTSHSDSTAMWSCAAASTWSLVAVSARLPLTIPPSVRCPRGVQPHPGQLRLICVLAP